MEATALSPPSAEAESTRVELKVLLEPAEGAECRSIELNSIQPSAVITPNEAHRSKTNCREIDRPELSRREGID